MLSINYAKKNGGGYVISFYADTVEDITNFDPTKSFGIYGIPQKGSIITLVSGTDSVNYYLGDSGEIVKIEVGGDEPTGDLTPFQIGDQIIDNVTKGKFNTSISIEDMHDFLAGLTYDGGDGDVEVCVLVGKTSADNNGVAVLAAHMKAGPGFYALMTGADGGSKIVFVDTDVEEIHAGWQELDENNECLLSDEGEDFTIGYINPTVGWNGVICGIVEGEPTPGGLIPFEVGQTITGVDFGNVENGDTNDTIATLLTGLAGQYSGDGIYTLLERSDGSGDIIIAIDLSNYGGTGYAIGVGETIVYATAANSGDIPTTVGFQNITDGKVMLPESTQVGEPDAATASTWNGIIMGAVVSE